MQDMERRVWGGEDIDVSPVLLMVALVKSGALLLGAFIDGRMRGFAFSVPGDRHGHRLHWSHMTGVDEALRSSGLGTRLKLEQARRVAARGYSRIQWTYDPLQSLNAHLNLVKLGASADEYAEHVYGDSTSDLHRGAPTDRFIATWLLDEAGVPMRSPRLARAAGQEGVAAGTVDDAGRLGRVPRRTRRCRRHPSSASRCLPGSRRCCRKRRTWRWPGACRRAHSSRRSLPRVTKRSRSAARASAASTCW